MDKNQFSKAAPLGYLIHEVARLFRRRFEEEAKIHGITLPQWKALAEIARNPGVTQVELAALADSDPMTMSGILDRLAKRGLIERSPDARDSRAKVVTITADGVNLVDMARMVGLGIYARSMKGVNAEEEEALRHALELIRDNLNGMTAEQKENA